MAAILDHQIIPSHFSSVIATLVASTPTPVSLYVVVTTRLPIGRSDPEIIEIESIFGGMKSVLSHTHEKYGTALVLIVVNNHPTRRLNELSFPSAYTVLFALGLRVRSSAPVGRILAIRLRATHQTVRNAHPMIIFQLLSMRSVCTVVLALGSKVASRTQRVDTLAILLRATHPTMVNCHQRTTCPSVCTSISQIAVDVRTGLKVASRTQSADTLAILVLAVHHIVVKSPPRRIFPSVWIAIV